MCLSPDRGRSARRAACLAVASALAALSIDPSTLRAQGETPHEIERQARRAVESGASESVRARWSARERASARDRAARLGLACLADLTYDFPAATARFRAISDTLSSPPDGYTAYARLAWARMDELRGAMREAEEGYPVARALTRRVGDRLAESMVLASQALLRANAQSLEAGLSTLDSAEVLLPRDAPDDVRADLARRRAMLLAVQLAPTARATTDDAIRLARRAGDRRAEANAMRVLALHHRMRSFPDSARAALDSTARLQRAARDRRALAETLVRIANEYLGERRLGDARLLLLDARTEALASHNDYALASVETGLGALALRVRDLPSALLHLARAEALNVAAGDSASLVVVRSFRAGALLDAGFLDSASSLQRSVLAQYQRSREIPDVIVAHRVLANIALAQRRYDVAARELDAAGSLVRRHRIPAAEPPLWFDRARLAHRTGRDDDASALLGRYIASLRPDDGVARWDAELHLAEIDARRGRSRDAARRLAVATDALESWRAAQQDSTLRLLAFQASAHEASDRDANFAAAIGSLARQGEADAAFELVERRRAQTLAERMVQAEALRAGATTSVAARAPLTRTRVADVARALPDDRTALLAYVTGASGAPTTLFVVTRAGARALALPSVDSVTPLIRRFLSAVESGDDATPLARSLGAALVAPALGQLDGIERLVIVPDGALHRVPFDAMRLPDGRALIERFETTLAPSAAVAGLLWRRTPRARHEAPRVLAFGNPAFRPGQLGPSVGTRAGDAESTFAAQRLARLPESGREARLVGRFGAGSVVRTGTDASAANFRRAALDSFSVLHLATHALVDERSLARSAIVLAAGEGESGLLEPGELSAMPMGVDLVVLSSCRSAGGVLVNGEGVQGLTAPLLAAGARAVVATGWPVDDREIVAIVEDFYRGLSRRESVGSALRSAKLAAMRRGAPVRDWAAFTVIGDGSVQVPLRPPRDFSWLIAGAVATVVASGFAVRRHRRRAGD